MASQLVGINRKYFTREALWSDTAVLIYLALIVVIGHLFTNSLYGYQRDEFYYILCGQHPAWGYVDHPPLTPIIASISLWLFGNPANSSFAIRFFPSIAGALVVLFTGLMARELGGNRFAQIMSAICIMLSPLFLAANGLLMPVSFDQLVWTLCSYLVIRLIKSENRRLWPLIGVVIGFGLLNKHTVLFYCFGLIVGLLLTKHRSELKSSWFWLGSLIALIIFLPNLIWQYQNHWATIEFLQNLNIRVMSKISRSQFLLWQVILLNPALPLVWLSGLYFYFFTRKGEPFRVLGWIYVIVLTLILILNGKPYYPGPAYPLLIAAGPIALMHIFRKIQWTRLRPALVTMVGIGALVASPVMLLPALPEESSIRYQIGKLDRDFAEVLGWPEFVSQVSKVYGKLSPEEKKKATILTENYGEAGAIEILGADHGLPKAISGHNNYYLWGPGNSTGEICITIGLSKELLETMFYEINSQGVITNKVGAKNEEFNKPIFICRHPKKPLKELWPRLKHFD